MSAPVECQPLVLSLGFRGGAVAQLGERLVCNQEVVGSIPIGSTRRADSMVLVQNERAGVVWSSDAMPDPCAEP